MRSTAGIVFTSLEALVAFLASLALATRAFYLAPAETSQYLYAIALTSLAHRCVFGIYCAMIPRQESAGLVSRADRMHAQGGHSLMLAFFCGFGALGSWFKHKLGKSADHEDDSDAKGKINQNVLSLLSRALVVHKRLMSWPQLCFGVVMAAYASMYTDGLVAVIAALSMTLSLCSLFIA